MKKILAAATAAAAIVAVAATPASAHTVKDYITTQSYLYTWGFVEVNSGGGAEHTQIAVCDTDADGAVVSVEFYFRRPGVFDDQYNKISDGNGSQAGCGRYTVPTGGRILGYQGLVRPNRVDYRDDTGWNWNL